MCIFDFRYAIDRKTDEGRRFTVSSNCEVKIRRGLDGETLDREALADMPDEMYEVHILAIDKGKLAVVHLINDLPN